MTMIKINVLLIIFALLSGCASTGNLQKVDVKKAPKASDLLACVKPSDLKTGEFKEVVLKLDEAVTLLNACAKKHEGLSEYIKENF